MGNEKVLRSANQQSPSRRKKLREHRRGAAVIAGLTSLSLIILGVSAAAVNSTGLQNSTPIENPLTASVSSWTIPQNEVSAPLVNIPGGAIQGAGAFNAVDCANATTCVAVGGDNNLQGAAMFSSNGGQSWTTASTISGLPVLNAVNCSTPLDCVAVGQGVVTTSTDGGQTWSPHSIPTSDTTLLGVGCPSPTNCISVGVIPGNAGPFGGQILTSSDGGITWSRPELPESIGALGSVSCPTSTFCVAVGSEILVSNDEGKTWAPATVDGGSGILRTISCASATNCIAIGENPAGMTDPSAPAFGISTADDGQSWQSVAMPPSSWAANAVSCSSDGSCVVSGPTSGKTLAPVWSTTNGGDKWTGGAPPSGVTAISSISCDSATNCVFVGLQGNNAVAGTPISNSGQVAEVSPSSVAAAGTAQ